MDNERAYMLDTNIFDRLLDNRISRSSLTCRRLLVTGVQRDELEKAKGERREELLHIHDLVVAPEKLPASSFCFGIEGAGFGQAYWNDGSGKREKMLARLRELDCQSGKKKESLNQERDIVIAETAIKNGAILVSDDGNLRKVVCEFRGEVMSSKEFAAAHQ